MNAIATHSASSSGRCILGAPSLCWGLGSGHAGSARWMRTAGDVRRDPGPGLLLVPITFVNVLGDA